MESNSRSLRDRLATNKAPTTMTYTQPASQETIERTVAALKANGIEVHVAQNGEEAR